MRGLLCCPPQRKAGFLGSSLCLLEQVGLMVFCKPVCDVRVLEVCDNSRQWCLLTEIFINEQLFSFSSTDAYCGKCLSCYPPSRRGSGRFGKTLQWTLSLSTSWAGRNLKAGWCQWTAGRGDLGIHLCWYGCARTSGRAPVKPWSAWDPDLLSPQAPYACPWEDRCLEVHCSTCVVVSIPGRADGCNGMHGPAGLHAFPSDSWDTHTAVAWILKPELSEKVNSRVRWVVLCWYVN